jgi:hypothetical protein
MTSILANLFVLCILICMKLKFKVSQEENIAQNAKWYSNVNFYLNFYIESIIFNTTCA